MSCVSNLLSLLLTTGASVTEDADLTNDRLGHVTAHAAAMSFKSRGYCQSCCIKTIKSTSTNYSRPARWCGRCRWSRICQRNRSCRAGVARLSSITKFYSRITNGRFAFSSSFSPSEVKSRSFEVAILHSSTYHRCEFFYFHDL